MKDESGCLRVETRASTEWVAVFPMALCHLWMEMRMPTVLICICVGTPCETMEPSLTGYLKEAESTVPSVRNPSLPWVVLFPL